MEWTGFSHDPRFLSTGTRLSIGSLYRMNKNKLIKVLTYTNINILPLDDGVRVD
jgi:hypothetical protein